MPRPIKEGLDYFPLDVDLDDKIYMVECELGLAGFALLIKLFIKIYKNGYYINWNEKTVKMFARQNNIKIDVVNKLLEVCINEEIIDKNLYEKYKILTSRGIQKRYLEAVKRRKEINLIKDYMLVIIVEKSINVNINWINADNNSINDYINKQSKVKDSKVKDSKEDKERKEVQKLVSASLEEKPLEKEEKKANEIEFDQELLSWYGIDEDIFDDWVKRFPKIDVPVELIKIREYFKNNPVKAKEIEKKFKGRFPIYINDWLERAEGYIKEDKI